MSEDRYDEITRILYPYASRRREDVIRNNTSFVHYTSAEAAMSIITNNCIWMRNSLLMNDYSEVQHGLKCWDYAWKSPSGERLRDLMQSVGSGLVEEFENWSINDRHVVLLETYLMSISEHGDADEDRYGRLSMWRAYGAPASVAMVFDQHPFVTPSDALRAYTMPVFYGNEATFLGEFSSFVDGLCANVSLFTALGDTYEFMLTALQDVFRFSVLSTKHPSFHEEREWRTIYCPLSADSQHIHKAIQCINGIPQTIYKIPFENHPTEGFTGATIPEILKKFIIGPMQSPYPTYQAFFTLLEQKNVSDIVDKISCSFVPLRT